MSVLEVDTLGQVSVNNIDSHEQSLILELPRHLQTNEPVDEHVAEVWIEILVPPQVPELRLIVPLSLSKRSKYIARVLFGLVALLHPERRSQGVIEVALTIVELHRLCVTTHRKRWLLHSVIYAHLSLSANSYILIPGSGRGLSKFLPRHGKLLWGIHRVVHALVITTATIVRIIFKYIHLLLWSLVGIVVDDVLEKVIFGQLKACLTLKVIHAVGRCLKSRRFVHSHASVTKLLLATFTWRLKSFLIFNVL